MLNDLGVSKFETTSLDCKDSKLDRKITNDDKSLCRIVYAAEKDMYTLILSETTVFKLKDNYSNFSHIQLLFKILQQFNNLLLSNAHLICSSDAI